MSKGIRLSPARFPSTCPSCCLLELSISGKGSKLLKLSRSGLIHAVVPLIHFMEWLVVDSLLFVPSMRLQNQITIFWLEVYPLCIVAYVEFVARGSESVRRRAGALEFCFVFPLETVEISGCCVKRELYHLFSTNLSMLLGGARPSPPILG